MKLSITPEEEGGTPIIEYTQNKRTLFKFPNKEMLLHNAKESIPERQEKNQQRLVFSIVINWIYIKPCQRKRMVLEIHKLRT